ncbi:MAG TPA: hypothetical protein VFO91_18680 [Anaerolineales bacterium]|nr:hypothetical protein [Anaerolineales bacterium]
MISGIGILVRAEWWTMLLGSAVFSSAILLLFWDGSMQPIVKQRVIGFLISMITLLALLWFKRSTFAF